MNRHPLFAAIVLLPAATGISVGAGGPAWADNQSKQMTVSQKGHASIQLERCQNLGTNGPFTHPTTTNKATTNNAAPENHASKAAAPAPGGSLHTEFHQVNGDGNGPFACQPQVQPGDKKQPKY